MFCLFVSYHKNVDDIEDQGKYFPLRNLPKSDLIFPIFHKILLLYYILWKTEKMTSRLKFAYALLVQAYLR